MIAFNDLKKIADVLKKAGKINEFNQILELQEQLLSMQDRIAKLKQEKEEVEKKNKKLKEKLNLKEDMEKKNNAYWKKSDGGGPFCSMCWEKDKKPISMILYYKGSNNAVCPVCKTAVNFTGKEDEIRSSIDSEKFNKFDVF